MSYLYSITSDIRQDCYLDKAKKSHTPFEIAENDMLIADDRHIELCTKYAHKYNIEYYGDEGYELGSGERRIKAALNAVELREYNKSKNRLNYTLRKVRALSRG